MKTNDEASLDAMETAARELFQFVTERGAVDAEGWQVICTHYSEPHRDYHTLRHILNGFALIPDDYREDHTLSLALLYHDIIYDPRRPDNESESAKLARSEMSRIGLSQSLIAEVSDLIIATDHSGDHDLTDRGRLLCDIDLSILGAIREEYDRYAEAIRKEYHWVPAEQYRKGRKSVLQNFLERDPIYLTPGFRDQFEEAARSNLRREISQLASSA